jgi:hypothetical protein
MYMWSLSHIGKIGSQGSSLSLSLSLSLFLLYKETIVSIIIYHNIIQCSLLYAFALSLLSPSSAL